MRLAPKLLMVAVTGVLVLTIFAATGSYTPKAIEQQIVTAIQSYQEPSPTPQENPAPAPKAAPAAPVTRPVPKPAETPKSEQPGKSPEPSESPRPSDSPASDSDHNDSRPGSGPPPGEQH
jgi:outer membrane biosynthesis protein TonB